MQDSLLAVGQVPLTDWMEGMAGLASDDNISSNPVNTKTKE